MTTGFYVYDQVGTGAWGEFWPLHAASACINPQLNGGVTEWVWNGQLCNTMNFTFAIPEDCLKEVCEVVPTPRPTERPTEEPSVAPTQCDICDVPLEEYLNQCFCDDDTSTGPGIGCGGFDHCVAYFDGCNWCRCTNGLGPVCTRIYCPRDEYEDAYCNGCEAGYVLNSDHECVPIGAAQSVNPMIAGNNDYEADFKKIHELMGYQSNLIYGLIGVNLITIMIMIVYVDHANVDQKDMVGLFNKIQISMMMMK